ncbi:MAG: hypothetical protein ABIP85_08055 [Chthoniobacteraceae bacterium]
MKFTKAAKVEDMRHLRESLTEDALKIYDLLKKAKMTKAEEQRVKLASRALLKRLKMGTPKIPVQEWFKDSQSKEPVQPAVKEVLNEPLPKTHDRAVFNEKCKSVFDLMIDCASDGRKWAAYGRPRQPDLRHGTGHRPRQNRHRIAVSLAELFR